MDLNQSIVEHILTETGIEGLLELLTHRLAPTDLQSLLMAVYRDRASRQTPARVLDQYAGNRFVRPGQVDLRARLELDRLALDNASAFEALDLAPLCPLGTVSALGPVDQNNVVTTIRNSEVVSDCTNVLALECALRRRNLRRDAATAGGTVRVCTSQRLVRAQNYNRPGVSAHFQVFALCTAGRAVEGYRFELEALLEQITCYLQLLRSLAAIGCRVHNVRVALTDLPDPAFLERLQNGLIDPLSAGFPDLKVDCDPTKVTVKDYYQLVRFHIYAATQDGTEHELADGGFTNWTRKLLSDKKERLLISGMGTERIHTLFR
jgi:hypothetical protein